MLFEMVSPVPYRKDTIKDYVIVLGILVPGVILKRKEYNQGYLSITERYSLPQYFIGFLQFIKCSAAPADQDTKILTVTPDMLILLVWAGTLNLYAYSSGIV